MVARSADERRYLLWRGAFFDVAAFQGGTSFALKIHALLCRPFLKGRDWFDFNGYVKQKIQPELPLLQAALRQFGPWRDQDIAVTPSWLGERLQEKIASIDWVMAADDVRRSDSLPALQPHSSEVNGCDGILNGRR